MSSSESDTDDAIFEVELGQQKRLKQYATIACVVGTYHNDTYLNKSERKESGMLVYDG